MPAQIFYIEIHIKVMRVGEGKAELDESTILQVGKNTSAVRARKLRARIADAIALLLSARATAKAQEMQDTKTQGE